MNRTTTAALAALLLLAGTAAALAEQPATQLAFLDRFFGGGKKQAQTQEKPAAYHIGDDASFAANTRAEHFRPYNNPYLEFDITVPRDWTTRDLTKTAAPGADQSVAGDIVMLQSEMIGIHRVAVTVSVHTLTHEISARDWLRNHVFASGFALQDMPEENGPRQARAYYTSVSEETGNMHSYIGVQITGNMALVTHADVPLPLQDYTAYVQKKIVDSVQLTYMRDDKVEQQKSFAMVDAVKFTYPASWDVQNPDFRDMTRPGVQLVMRGASGAIDGYIRMLAVRRSGETNLRREIEDLRKTFPEVMETDITKLISSADLPKPPERFLFAREEVYAAAYRKSSHSNPEVRLAVLGDKEWYLFVYLITPRENDNLFTWGRNVRTLNLIIESMK